MAKRSSTLYDAHGRQISYEFFEGGKTSGLRDRPVAYYNGANDTKSLLPTSGWKQLMSSGRFLFANVPILRGALLEQAAHSFPLMPQYTGKDKDWGKLAEEFIYEWQKDCNVRGRPYTAQTGSRLRMLGRKIDGDFGTVLTWRSPQDTFPQVQYVRAHRIGDREDGKDGQAVVQRGPYKGNRILNGVISNAQGRPLAYRVLGDTPDEDQDISARNMFLSYRPDYSDQNRGISELCAAITTMADVKRLREYEMVAQQKCAAVTFVEKNESGTADMSELLGAGSQTSTEPGLIAKTYDKGMTLYYKSGTGSGLEVLRGDRPAADAQTWEDRMIAGAFYGIEWDPNFALAIKEPGGAWARTIIQKIIRAIANNICIESDAMRLEVAYAIALALELGILPWPKTNDWWSWEFTLGIPLITADSGNEENALREAYKLGTTTLRAIAGRSGDWWEELRDQRQEEARDLLRRAKEIQTEFPELTLQEALTLLEQRTPNANTSASGKEEEEPAMAVQE
jgi:hypothetical protein